MTTVLLRLAAGSIAGGQPNTANNLLPDFIPATLFANLSLAEVEIALPRSDPTVYPTEKP